MSFENAAGIRISFERGFGPASRSSTLLAGSALSLLMVGYSAGIKGRRSILTASVLILVLGVVSLRQEDGVLRPNHEIEKAMTPSQYHYFPLEESWRGKHKKFTDVTFRALLILTLLDRAETG